jgi:hypothetical protein
MPPLRSHEILFNDERYQRCHLQPGDRLFRYDHSSVDGLVGTVAGVVSDGLLDCGHSAPFGGVDFARPRESVGVVVELLKAVIAQASKDGIREIRVRARPHYFGENETSIDFALFNLGGHVESCELSLGVQVHRYSSADDYLRSLSDSARNMVRQGLRANMLFKPAHDLEEWRNCFDLLVEARHRRGATLKFSFEHLLELRKVFGQRITMQRLLCGAELAAAALVYRIAPQWEYLVSWGDERQHRPKRVMNLMAYHLIGLSISQGVRVFDTGISSVTGASDDKLVQFKRSIGAVAGLRRNYLMRIAG